MIIGTRCGLVKPGTLVYPKEIPGYIAPDPQPVTENKQKITFNYTPINYMITYDLDGGTMEGYKETFTILDDPYTPPIPVKADCTFTGWNIKRVDSSEKLTAISGIGDVKCTATWIDNAILLPGEDLNVALDILANGKENIMAIQAAPELIVGDYQNLSSTSTPIFGKYDSGVIYIYCQTPIYCNSNMSGAFEGMTILRDIAYLKNLVCPKNADISNLFLNCSLLSDVSAVENWANGEFSNFDNAFTGTYALTTGRVPNWYRWNVTINYESSSGTVLEVNKDESHIPGETIFPKYYTGYKPFTSSITIDNKSIEYTFIYNPISYKITYMVDGKVNTDIQTTAYTIEDVDYYPPELSKEGYTFSGWSPECIKHGEYGDVTFIASFRKN